MTPLEQQVREALTDEVLQQICSHVFWKRNTSARDVIFAAINPVLAQHAQQAQQVRSKWHLEERAGCQVIAANDGSWCCPATDRELELIAQVQALTDERDRAREMVKRFAVGVPYSQQDKLDMQEIATWPK